MILVVSAGATDTGALDLDALEGRRLERVDSPAAAADCLDRGAADVVWLAHDEVPVELLERLRDGAFDNPRIPVVLAAGDVPDDLPLLAFDQVVDPAGSAGPETLQRAVETALAVADYQTVLAEFYDACQSRADAGVTDPLEESARLRELRESADDHLADLLCDPEVIADLLWQPDGAAPSFGFEPVDSPDEQ
ncbi:MAG: hypothetical protein ABEJ42_06625 [Halobacteriaceae archaeon]